MIAPLLTAIILQLPPIDLPPLPVPPLPPPPCIPLIDPGCVPPVPAPPGDDPPVFPDTLTATKDDGYIVLRWKPARDDITLAGYRFYRDGDYIGRRGPTITHVRLRLPCGRHRFRVEAVDSADQPASRGVTIRRRCS